MACYVYTLLFEFQAHRCIQECHVEQLITESKFLRGDSLQELIKVSTCLLTSEMIGVLKRER